MSERIAVKQMKIKPGICERVVISHGKEKIMFIFLEVSKEDTLI